MAEDVKRTEQGIDSRVSKGEKIKRRKSEEKENLNGGKGKSIYSREYKEDRTGNGQKRFKDGKYKHSNGKARDTQRGEKKEIAASLNGKKQTEKQINGKRSQRRNGERRNS